MAEGGALNLGHDIAHLGLRRCVLEFASGTTIGALWWRWRNVPRLPGWCAAAVSAALLLLWAGGTMQETLAIPGAFAAGLLAFALSSGRKGNPLEVGWLHYLGEISYATYLSHFLLFVLFLYGPTIVIFILSFQGPTGGLTFPLNGISVHWFERLWAGGGIVISTMTPLPHRRGEGRRPPCPGSWPGRRCKSPSRAATPEDARLVSSRNTLRFP